METGNIKARSIACKESLLSLVAGAKSPSRPGIVDLREIENYQERFDQWTGNLGAFHDPESKLSLEYRLRNNAIIRDAILRLLADLCDSARSALDIVSGKQQNRTALPLINPETDLAEFDVCSGSESSKTSSGENPPQVSSATEIEELASAIRGSINSLFKTSVFIRKFAPNERHKRAAEKTDSFASQMDEMYIRDRYPAVERRGRGDLVVRLGLANAHRRQYFTYCREHNDRLSGTDAAKDRKKTEIPRLGPESRQEVVTTAGDRHRSFLATTEATDLLADNEASGEFPKFLQAAPTPTLVSYATTIDKSVDDDTAFPPLPSDAHNNSFFLCPYCRKIVKLNTTDKVKHWRKHVLSDLEPYVCTYPGCSLDTYQSQHAWFDHELLIHRGTWPCFRCGEVADAAEILQSHIETHHSDHISPQQLPMVVEQSRRQPKFIHPNECPFCDEDWARGETSDAGVLVVTSDEFRRHLGQHLQRIALFSLPRLGQNQDASSSAVTGGNTDRSLFSITSHPLGDQIMEGLVVSTFPPGSHQVYMPEGNLDQLITEQAIVGELSGARDLASSDQIDLRVDDDLIQFIFGSAKKVFAISLICGVEGVSLNEAMRLFKSNAFDDSSLPIKSTDPGEAPWSQLQWTALITHKFRQRQWMFLVPVLRRDVLNMDLEPHHILPFALAPNETPEGRSRKLWEVTVHEAHQEQPMRKLDNSLATAAIQACETEATYSEIDADERWKKEDEFLEDIRKLGHLHIVKMEAIITWAGRGRYFIYKWPDGGNLRDFYASDTRPSLEAGFVRAIFQQLAGLVDALRSLHYLESIGASLYPSRHGNLEPEDIWRYEDGSRVGAMRLRGVGWNRNHVRGDSTLDRPSYEPPEAASDPHSTRSGRYDMWSIGCIILELIVWLLYGTDELEVFIRGMNVTLESCSPYWVTEGCGAGDRVRVHPKVQACMDHIEKDPECNGARATAISDILTIVRTRLLVVQLPSITVSRTQGRAESSELLNALRSVLEKGRSESEYWYTGMLREGLSGPAKSMTTLQQMPSSSNANTPTSEAGGLHVALR